ncbi:MAG: DNA recombination protein RmuC [Eubacteriales bacterium]|nr:DNA recombination protein RmuC [Eubacteriales bacterium]
MEYLPYIAASAACVLLALIVMLLRLDRLQRSLRSRLVESEKRTREAQAQLAQSVHSVTQLTATTTDAAERRMNELSDRLDARLSHLEKTNEARLNSIELMVSERLDRQLEKRLNSSFGQVSAQLEKVYRGLGEMQSLASGVGDLKKVLSGVKTRGIWGEVQLGALLCEMLAPSQYRVNTPVVPGSAERVEFAVCLPGREGEGLLLPIDSKFPLDPFERLIAASESGDKDRVEQTAQQLARSILEQGKKISEKYVKPPHTTDFALMFLPVESLYAEVLRRVGLAQELQDKYHVVVCGPSTLCALLSSLQMGFRTVSIEQRTGEVWQTLGQLRAEFSRFGDSLDRMRQRLDQASGELDGATARSRAISRRLDALERTEEER